MNSANRNFALVLGVAAAPFGALFFASCGFMSYLTERVRAGGIEALARGWLLPTSAMLVLLTVGIAAGVTSAVRQVRATRRLSEHIAAATVPVPAGTPAGIDVVDHPEAFAFTFGLVSPRIALSSGLVEHLSSAEFAAVVAHERYHQGARDPLKLVVARVAARTCFFLPAVGHLVARYLAGRELAADRRALRAGGQAALAGALFKVVAGPGWSEMDTAAAMAGPDLLAVRVDQLESGAEPTPAAVPVVAVVVSAIVLAVLMTLVAAVTIQGGVSMSGGTRSGMSARNVGEAIASGLVCSAGWIWLASVAFRQFTRPPLTTTST